MKLYSDKSNARRAARQELGAEVAFEIIEQDGKFGWVVPASVQAPAADFEPVEQPAKPRKNAMKELGTPPVLTRKARKAQAEDLPEPAAELPTSFVPEADEIASREYGMLSTRQRAGEAAKAAGVSDPVISQTARGMWVWRTPALNQVWRESQKPPHNPETAQREPRVQAKTAAAFEAAQRGELPAVPDFSADTHKPYRKRLEELRQLVKAGDLEALRAYPIKASNTSTKCLDRYRNHAVCAIAAQAARKAS